MAMSPSRFRHFQGLEVRALPAFNRSAVAIPNHERLLRELRGLERRTHRSGKDSVDHPAHGSDDHANALCGALYIAIHETHKPKMRMGTYNPFAGDGKIHWKDTEPQERTRVRFVRVDEHGNELTREQAQAIKHTTAQQREAIFLKRT